MTLGCVYFGGLFDLINSSRDGGNSSKRMFLGSVETSNGTPPVSWVDIFGSLLEDCLVR